MEGVGHHIKIALLGAFEQGCMSLHTALVGPGLDMLAAELGIVQPALDRDLWNNNDTFNDRVTFHLCLSFFIIIIIIIVF